MLLELVVRHTLQHGRTENPAYGGALDSRERVEHRVIRLGPRQDGRDQIRVWVAGQLAIVRPGQSEGVRREYVRAQQAQRRPLPDAGYGLEDRLLAGVPFEVAPDIEAADVPAGDGRRTGVETNEHVELLREHPVAFAGPRAALAEVQEQVPRHLQRPGPVGQRVRRQVVPGHVGIKLVGDLIALVRVSGLRAS